MLLVGQDQWSGSPSNADTFARGLLVGPGGELPDSAVESHHLGPDQGDLCPVRRKIDGRPGPGARFEGNST